MKKSAILLIISVFSLTLLVGCNDSGITPIPVPPSDITRTGKFIAFTSNQNLNYDIWLAQVDASGFLVAAGLVYPTNPINMTPSWTGTDKQPNWSPDGRMLVFSRTDGNQEEIYAFFFNADGSIDSGVTPNPKKLFSSQGNWDENPFFSPDGLYLIWDRRTDTNGGGIDTSDSRDLFRGAASGTGNSFTVSNITALTQTINEDEYNAKWSPKISVRRILYELASSATSTDHDIYIMDPLTPAVNQNYYNPGRSGYPAWEPACTRVIFESDQGNGGFYKIVSASYPAPGTPYDIAQSSVEHLRYPTWFPNSGLIAYIRIPANIGNIYIVSSTGGAPRKLLPANFDNSDNLWPAW